eukprot:gene39085-44310_t
MLASMRFEASAAASGAEALQRVRAAAGTPEAFDVVLLDHPSSQPSSQPST